MDNRINPDMQTVYDEAQIYYEKGEFQKALNLFHEISDAWPDFSVLNYIGCCYIGMEDYKTAEKVFKMLISKAPDWERPYFNLARVYIVNGQDGKAYELLKKAVEINPSSEDSYFYMGVYYRIKGQWDNAIEQFLKSEDLDDGAIEVHINLSVCYAEIGDYEKSLSEALKALEINSSDSDSLFNATRVYIIQKEYEKAFELLYNQRMSFCDDIGLMKNLFISALKTGHYDICVETAKKILAIDKNDSMSKRFLSDFGNDADCFSC